MRVLVVGSGGREHALAWKISRSPLVRALFAAPGNPGIASVATLVPLQVGDLDGIVGWAKANAIDLVVVGPEAPLVAGLVDRLTAEGILAFGPSAAAAEIEGSKAFAKDVMRAAGIPTAEYETFDAVEPALAWARARGGRLVTCRNTSSRLAPGPRRRLSASNADSGSSRWSRSAIFPSSPTG